MSQTRHRHGVCQHHFEPPCRTERSTQSVVKDQLGDVTVPDRSTLSVEPCLHRNNRTSGPLAGFIRNRHRNRGGAAVVEFAIVAPLLFMLVFGIIEFGRMIMVQQILTNASREGARRAIIEDVSGSEVVNLVSEYLTASSIDGATVTVEPMSLNLGFGDPVTVTVEVPFADVSWGGSAWFLGGSTFQASTVMHGERLQ